MTYRTNMIITKSDTLISAEDLRKQSSEISVSNELFEKMLSKLMSKIQSAASKGLYSSVLVDVDDLYEYEWKSDENGHSPKSTMLSKQEEFQAAKLLARRFKNLGYTVSVRKEGSSCGRPNIMISWEPKWSYWLKEFMLSALRFVFTCFLIKSMPNLVWNLI